MNKGILLSVFALAVMVGESLAAEKALPRDTAKLLISFDDRNFPGWEEALPLFAAYDARVTFFVNGRIDDRAVAFMRRARAAGHSLGLHGLGHLSAPKAVRQVGRLAYVRQELLPQLDAARAAGFEIRNFGCPYSDWDKTCEELWGRYFARVRSGHLHHRDPVKEPLLTLDRAFAPTEPFGAHRVMPALGFGDGSATTLDELKGALRRVRDRRETLLLVAHRITATPKPGDVSPKYLEGLLAAARALGIAVVGYDEVAGRPTLAPEGPGGTRRAFTADDFVSKRADGRFANTTGFILDRFRKAQPAFSFDGAKTPTEHAERRAAVRSRLRDLLGLNDWKPATFRKLGEAPRDGYTLETWEMYPEERLAVPFYRLVPDAAKRPGAKTPAVVCLPGSGYSKESLAGEPDAHYTMYPLRNRQARHLAKAGLIAIALENPATANNTARDLNYWYSRVYFFELMKLAGRSQWGLLVGEVLSCLDWLKRDPQVDATKLAISGLSLGISGTLYTTVLSDDVCCAVHNNMLCPFQRRHACVTERRGDGTAYAAQPLYGAIRFFDDDTDLMSAVAPRPYLLAEGGLVSHGIDKVRRAYELLGAEEALDVSWYRKYAKPESRRFDDLDVLPLSGLTDRDYLEVANCDPGDHSFHPEVTVPRLRRRLTGDATLPKDLADEIAASQRETVAPYAGRGYPGLRPFRPADFETTRADGRYVESMGFAYDLVRRMRPDLGGKTVRERLLELLELPAERSFAALKRISEAPVENGVCETWEIYPEDGYVVTVRLYVPAGAKASTPAVVCVAGNSGLDEQTRAYLKAGFVALALDLPATGSQVEKNMWWWSSMSYTLELMTLVGRTYWGLAVEEVLASVDLLRRHPRVDRSRIVASGLNDGARAALYATVVSDGIAALVHDGCALSEAERAVARRSFTGGVSAIGARPLFGACRYFTGRDLVDAVAPRPVVLSADAWKVPAEDARTFDGEPDVRRFDESLPQKVRTAL